MFKNESVAVDRGCSSSLTEKDSELTCMCSQVVFVKGNPVLCEPQQVVQFVRMFSSNF